MASPCRYDDSLPELIKVLVAELGVEHVASGVALRDATGRLAFFVNGELSAADVDRSSRLVRARLGPYARPDRCVADREAPGASLALSDPGARELDVGASRIRYLDRRIVGADWLHPPSVTQVRPPRFVFASLKGGVGRSTALSIVAAEHVRRGRNVLVVDLDLEAPGIGSMLLTSDRRPLLGALDYLVERNLGALTPLELDNCVGTSSLTSGAGLVDVVPVVGSRSYSAPENYLSKLSRAMIEDVTDGHPPLSVAEKIGAMLKELESRRPYDLVLVDARAGLAELAAGPLLCLGANVLLFGTAQPQTIEGLRFLFAHLSSLVREGDPSPWQALKMVHAKAQLAESHERFKDDLWGLFSEYLYEEQDGLEGFNFDVNAPDAPHNAIAVPFDLAFADWDPAERPAKLVEEYYVRTFAPLLRFIDDVVSRGRP